MTLHDGRPIELLHFRGHTAGDTVVFLPEEKILITGDLLDEIPSGWRGFLPDWIEALDTLEAFDFDIVVPGHGGVHRGKDLLYLARDLLTTINEAARDAVAKGKSVDELKASIDLESIRERLVGDDALKNRVFDRFIPETIERAHQYFSESR